MPKEFTITKEVLLEAAPEQVWESIATELYIEAEGPASSAAPEAWPILAAALGTAGPAEPGSHVHIGLPGTGPLHGVIDYATPNFIGLRTPDALIRFHGRSGLGMAVAVSHHAYSDHIDAEATTRAWKAWLDRTLTAGPDSPS